VAASLERLWGEAGAATSGIVLSGATGAAAATTEEREALGRLAPDAQLYALGDLVGHTMEPQALIGTAIAAGLIEAGQTSDAVVTSVGHHRGEGLVRLTKPR
jgi:3-oxoacyl-[acyl-carrier-protein] synthase II